MGPVQRAAKTDLRARLSAERRARPADDVEAARRLVRAAVVERADAAGWRCVGAYVPLPSEPGSTQLLDALAARGIRVLVPLLLPDRDLDWAEWDQAAQQPGTSVGVDAISRADAVLVPALAVARDGVRLGRGGGSYDRALRRVAPGVPTAALLFGAELVENLPADAWDVSVSAVVTPGGWQDLSDH
jgi:5-formyltetrahydrofolate cyclo-ligase